MYIIKNNIIIYFEFSLLKFILDGLSIENERKLNIFGCG